MDISKVFPGHYENFSNAAETIDYQVGRINLRKEECLHVIRNGKSHFMDIGLAMYGRSFSPAGH